MFCFTADNKVQHVPTKVRENCQKDKDCTPS